MSKIFISYAHEDAEIAREVSIVLEDLNLTPWLDRREIVPGDSFLGRMNEGLEDASYLLFLVSSASLRSHWATREWMAALAIHSTIVVPLLLENVQLPALIRDIVYIDLRNRRDGLEALRSFFRRELQPPAKAPTDTDWRFRAQANFDFGALTLREIRLVANACLSDALLNSFLIDAEINPHEILGGCLNDRIASFLHKVNRDGIAISFAEWLALEQRRCFEHQLARIRSGPRWTLKTNTLPEL
jgi:hypothetical protein